MKIEETNKKIVLGQYFTKKNIVDMVINLLLEYKPYNKEISVLEPSAGTKNFVKGIKKKDLIMFKNVK